MAGRGTRTTRARLGDANVHTQEGNEGPTKVVWIDFSAYVKSAGFR